MFISAPSQNLTRKSIKEWKLEYTEHKNIKIQWTREKKIVWKVGKMVDEFYEWLRGKKIEF